MEPQFALHASYEQLFTSGAVTTIAAGTASAGHLMAWRWTDANKVARLRSLELEFLLTTAFTAAQEVAFDLFLLRGYVAAHSAGSAMSFASQSGAKRSAYANSLMTGQVCGAGALTAGTHTLDTNALAASGMWAGAVGALLQKTFDFMQVEPRGGGDPRGIFLQQNMGLLVRNAILMGATGVGKWRARLRWDEGVLLNP
jgi:hypothetical protein